MEKIRFSLRHSLAPAFLWGLLLNLIITVSTFGDFKPTWSIAVLCLVCFLVFVWGALVGYFFDEETGVNSRFSLIRHATPVLLLSWALSFLVSTVSLFFDKEMDYPAFIVFSMGFLLSVSVFLIPFYSGCFFSRVARFFLEIFTAKDKMLHVKIYAKSLCFLLAVLALGTLVFISSSILTIAGGVGKKCSWVRGDASQTHLLIEDIWKAEENTGGETFIWDKLFSECRML